jgi:hypothetical protein
MVADIDPRNRVPDGVLDDIWLTEWMVGEVEKG